MKNMKLNLLLAAISIGLGWTTCKKLQKPDDGAALQQPKSEVLPNTGENYPFKVAHVLGSNDDTSATVMVRRAPDLVQIPLSRLPPASTSRKAYLGTGWWHLNMAFQPTDTTIHEHYKKKWLHFNEDQTFELLINNQVVDKGRWNWDENKNEIYLECKDPYVNNTWQVKDKGFVMIWIGNTDVNYTGIQVRAVNSKTPPSAGN